MVILESFHRVRISFQPDAARERDRTMKTALHYCAESPTLTCADLVLSAAHDLVDARDEDGYTPIHLAVIAGNKPLIKFLLSKNADVNSLDNERHSVVHWATGKLTFSVASFWSQMKNKILFLLKISLQIFA